MEQRQQKILNLLNQHGSLLTDDLAKTFAVTAQTIRRDINALCEVGLARKQHGGITLPPARDNLSISQRAVTNAGVKRKISVAAQAEIVSGSTLFLGYGSTVAQFAHLLPFDVSLTVVTNNLDAINYLSEYPDIDVWVAGGRLRHQHRDMGGLLTQQFFQSFKADIAIVGIGGVSERGELLEFQFDEGELTKTMLSNSRKRIVLADASKFGRNASVCIGTLESIDVLYSDCCSTKLAQLCLDHQVEFQNVEGTS